MLDYLSKTRDAATLAAAGGDSEQSAGEQAEPTYMTSSEWDELSEEKRDQHLLLLADHLTDCAEDDFLDHMAAKLENQSYWQSGQEARGKGLKLTDCPMVPGPEQDDWVRGFLYAENADIGDEQETSEGETTKPGQPVDLDDL